MKNYKGKLNRTSISNNLGLEDYKILRRSSSGQFIIPEGWKVLSLADLSQSSVQAAMLSLFTSSTEVDMFNKGELKVIRGMDAEEEIPEYDVSF
jgi:hypothetical protein